MIEVKRFGGALNLDDLEENISPIQHIDGKNISFRGGSNGLTAMNIKGNFLINNSNLPEGWNECAGSFYDSVKRRILYWNFNSNNNHGLYQLLVQTGQITQLFRCGVDSATDILNISLDYPVHSMAIVYRTDGDGDLLYWVQEDRRPKYLNLDTIQTLAPFTEDMINAAKLPPLAPPVNVGYVSDATFNANRVKNKYFQFAYRWLYVNLEKSTLSPFSITPIPENIINPQADINTNTNNAIDISVVTAATADYAGLEIVGREWLGSAWSDCFLIQTIKVADFATPLPFFYTFRFFNNGTYATIPTDESDLYYDHLPDKANTLELLNGNVLIYGGITSGYDNLTRQQVDVQITTSLISSTTYPAASKAWKWSQYQRFGLQYFDKWGKPIGGVVSFLEDAAIDTTNFDITTTEYLSEINGVSYPVPKIFSTINHLPPADAESYCWVRQDLTPPFFLQWMTNDYQSDSEYLYLCIQSLIESNTKNGFLPSYEFTNGDRVRIMAKYGSTEFTTAFSIQLDFEILGIVQRVMGSGNPAVNGAFLKVRKPVTFPSPTYGANMLIEMYTPPVGLSSNTTPFYEWGQRYGFQTLSGVKYHLGGTQNQTSLLPALTEWVEGDVYLKSRQVYPTIAAATYTLMMMDRGYNDFQASAANSNGRAWVIDPNAKQEYNGVLVRWGGKYQAGTNINNLNRFRPTDYDEADRAKGDIRRFKARERILRCFQDIGVGQWGVYARFIQNNSGVPELVTTNEIITVNNIQYYQGRYGVGGYPTNLCSSTIADYFADVVTGREVRLSGDGMTDLGLLYKGQFYLSRLVTPYNKTLSRSRGSRAKVMKYWDSYENQSHTVLQGGGILPPVPFIGRLIFAFNESMSSTEWGLAFFGTANAGDIVEIIASNGVATETYSYTCFQGDTAFIIRNALIALINVSANFSASTATHGVWPGLDIETLVGTIDVVATIYWAISEQVTDFNYSFNETRNAFCSFYDFHPEWAISADDIVYTWKNGHCYKHDNQLYYCNFYNENFGCHVTAVFNQNLLQKKSWQSITEIASDKFECPVIYTDSKSFRSQRQQTNLVPAEFTNLEDKFVSAIKRDANSRDGKLNGDQMKGSYLVIKFQKHNAQYEISLNSIAVNYADSPLNKR